MNPRRFSLLLVFGFILPVPAEAYECDDFGVRGQALVDASGSLDREFDRAIDAALTGQNSEGAPCAAPASYYPDLPPFYERLRAEIDTGPVAEIETYCRETLPASQRGEVAFDLSIYGAMGFLDGPVLKASGVGPSLRIGRHTVGADKFGHFASQGFDYFRMVYEGASVREARQAGLDWENGEFGIATTGVRSFGDLAANEAGMRFFASLAFGPNPYVRCESASGHWIRVRSFHVADYVTAAWDESVNCSEFSESMSAVVSSALAARDLRCPVSVDECRTIAIAPCAAELVSLACRRAAGVDTLPAPVCVEILPGLPTAPVAGSCPIPPPAPSSGYIDQAYRYVTGLIEEYVN